MRKRNVELVWTRPRGGEIGLFRPFVSALVEPRLLSINMEMKGCEGDYTALHARFPFSP